MTLYITDNPYIRKEISGCILLYQIFNWKIIEEDESFNIIKKYKLKNNKELIERNKELICIVNRSNYKLIHELYQLNKTIKFYYWDTWKKREEVFPDKEYSKQEFFKYLQRGFFTRKIYNALASYNFRRIEQFLVSISLTNNLEYKDDYKVIKLINSILHYRPSLSFAIDKLIYHSRKNDITDPFTGNFEFISTHNSLYKLYNEELEDHILLKYIKSIIYNNIQIMPFSDILKTLRFIEILGIINVTNNNVKINIEIGDDFSDFLNIEKWKLIYESGDFSMFNIFPMFEENRIKFVCPECKFPDYNSSPKSFWCANNNCNFRLDRIISPAGKAMKISEHDFLRILKHGSTVIKNKMGGYNNYFIIKNGMGNGKYNLMPQIKKNDIKAD